MPCGPWSPAISAAPGSTRPIVLRGTSRCRASSAIPISFFAQCCGYDIVYGFAASVTPLATPCYAAPGCDGRELPQLRPGAGGQPRDGTRRPPRRDRRRQQLQLPFRDQRAPGAGRAAGEGRALLRRGAGYRRASREPRAAVCRRSRRDGDGLRAPRAAHDAPARGARRHANPCRDGSGPGAAAGHLGDAKARSAWRSSATHSWRPWPTRSWWNLGRRCSSPGSRCCRRPPIGGSWKSRRRRFAMAIWSCTRRHRSSPRGDARPNIRQKRRGAMAEGSTEASQ